MCGIPGRTIISRDLGVISVRLSKVLANIASDDYMCGVPERTIILRDLVVISVRLSKVLANIVSDD